MKKVHTKIRNEPASRTGAVTSSSLPDEKKKQTAERDARALARSSSRITDKKTNKNSKKTKNTLPDDKKEKEEQSFFQSLSLPLLSGRALENSVQFTVALGFRICAKRKRTELHPLFSG